MYQNIRPKTEQDRVVEILMKLSESDRNEVLNYVRNNLMISSKLVDDKYDYAAEDEDYGFDPYWPTQGCEA